MFVLLELFEVAPFFGERGPGEGCSVHRAIWRFNDFDGRQIQSDFGLSRQEARLNFIDFDIDILFDFRIPVDVLIEVGIIGGTDSARGDELFDLESFRTCQTLTTAFWNVLGVERGRVGAAGCGV